MHSQTMLALLAFVIGLPLVASGQSQQPNVPTRLTRQPDFGIPFQLAPNRAVAPAEVQLYVSARQGRDWQLYQRRPANGGGFQFRAPADGEYWFAVRTVDRQGQLMSHQGWQPELKVIVDTTLPRLDLRVNTDTSGQVTAEWLAEDPNLAPYTFRMQYLAANGQWQDVAVETPAADDWRQEWQNRAQWSLTQAGRDLLVRAEILDRAGNVTTVNKTVSLAPLADRAANRFASPTPQSRFSAPGGFGEAETSTNDWKTGRREQALGLPAWLNDVQHAQDAFGAAPARQLSRDRTAARLNREDFATEPISSSIEPPVANRYQQVAQAASPKSFFPSREPNRQTASAADMGQEIRPRISASPNFALEYELFDVGPMGVRMVELWFTRDRGATWELYGSDADKQSPVEVHLKKEGLYGFRLVVHGHNAATPQPPNDGEPADIWVGVDWTKPLARILRATYGVGADQDAIVIQWQAEDALLVERPITLNYSQSPQGPWVPIQTGLPNSGTFRWRPGSRLASPVYLQIEVSDLAGNVTTAEYGSPVMRRGAAPRGLIRDIRPLEQASTFEPFRR